MVQKEPFDRALEDHDLDLLAGLEKAGLGEGAQTQDLAELRLPTTRPASPYQRGGRLRSDRVVAFDRIEWPLSVGTGGRIPSKSALITLSSADANEVVEAWRVVSVHRHQPACLVLSRQPLPTFDRVRFAPVSGLMGDHPRAACRKAFCSPFAALEEPRGSA